MKGRAARCNKNNIGKSGATSYNILNLLKNVFVWIYPKDKDKKCFVSNYNYLLRFSLV